MPEFAAETAYLFRHALLRDAAYELHLPGDRAKLHELAFYQIERAFGGRAPEPPDLKHGTDRPMSAHGIDAVALELSEHALLGAASESANRADLLTAHALYVHRAARHLAASFQVNGAVSAWLQLSRLVEGSDSAAALRHAAIQLMNTGRAPAALPLLEQALGIVQAPRPAVRLPSRRASSRRQK